MSGFLVGSRLTFTVPVIDKASAALVDPATFLFTLVGGPFTTAAPATYSWNGATWTNSESTIAVPARVSLGTFTLRVDIPYANTAQGNWVAAWHTTPNVSGLGGGSGELAERIAPSSALP